MQSVIRRLPKRLVEQKAQRLDYAANRLKQVFQSQLSMRKQRVLMLRQRLNQVSPQVKVAQQRKLLLDARRLLNQETERLLHRYRVQLQGRRETLEALNPQKLLDRGYSITTDAEGNVVSSARQLKPGSILKTRLQDGEVASIVTKDSNQPELF